MSDFSISVLLTYTTHSAAAWQLCPTATVTHKHLTSSNKPEIKIGEDEGGAGPSEARQEVVFMVKVKYVSRPRQVTAGAFLSNTVKD